MALSSGGRCLFYMEVLGLGTSFTRLGPAATACGPKLCLHRATPAPPETPRAGPHQAKGAVPLPGAPAWARGRTGV